MKSVQNTLRNLRDSELLLSTKDLVRREREITTEVLRHLAEIERRKLYADLPHAKGMGLKYSSLFDYAVHELGYSESAAGRRIQAMRLVREFPEMEAKIESGALNLSNICQAQGFFRDLKRAEPERVVSKDEKVAVFAKLEQKSSREGEKILLSLAPAGVLPRERERAVTPEHVEVRLILTQTQKDRLKQVRALMGSKGAGLSLSELIDEMAQLSLERLQEKRFGKRRVQLATEARRTEHRAAPEERASTTLNGKETHSDIKTDARNSLSTPGAGSATPLPPAAPVRLGTRHISQAVKHRVWHQAGGKCTACGSQHKLQFDHVQPVALGGESTTENIQLLCASCNLRRGIRTFDMRAMRRG